MSGFPRGSWRHFKILELYLSLCFDSGGCHGVVGGGKHLIP